MQTVQLDLVVNEGETIAQVAEELSLGLDVTYRVVTEHGPGGSWPEVEFTGEPTDLGQVEARYNASVA